MGVNSLLKTFTRQRRDCDLNQGLTAPESSTLTTRLPSQPSRCQMLQCYMTKCDTSLVHYQRWNGRTGQAGFGHRGFSVSPKLRYLIPSELYPKLSPRLVVKISMLSGVHSRQCELNWTDLYQVDPVTRHVIGHVQFSSVPFSSSAVNTALDCTDILLLLSQTKCVS